MANQGEKVLMPILRFKANSEKEASRGFTILELIIVAGIVLALTLFGLNKAYKKTPYVIKSESRKLAGLIQYLYNTAMITNKTYRLAIDLNNETHWVEFKDMAGWQLATESLLRKKKLANEIQFKDVYLTYLKEKKENGMVYIHFFPHGYVEAGTIHLIDKQGVNYSLEIKPLTGSTQVHVGYQ